MAESRHPAEHGIDFDVVLARLRCATTRRATSTRKLRAVFPRQSSDEGAQRVAKKCPLAMLYFEVHPVATKAVPAARHRPLNRSTRRDFPRGAPPISGHAVRGMPATTPAQTIPPLCRSGDRMPTRDLIMSHRARTTKIWKAVTRHRFRRMGDLWPKPVCVPQPGAERNWPPPSVRRRLVAAGKRGPVRALQSPWRRLRRAMVQPLLN